MVDGKRVCGKLTTAEAKEYEVLRRSVTTEEEEWMQRQRGPPMERPAEPVAMEVLAAGDGRRGGKE